MDYLISNKNSHRSYLSFKKKKYQAVLKENGVLKPDENIKWDRNDVYVASVIRDGQTIELARFYNWGK